MKLNYTRIQECNSSRFLSNTTC